MGGLFKKAFDGRALYSGTDLSGIMVEIDQDTLARLQGELLSMYKDVFDVCKKLKIIPYLIGGSALGAIRHQGFIPWDDDVDIGMTRTDYRKFVNAFESELSSKYIINAPNYSDNPKARFTKIYKKGTVFKGVYDVNDDSVNGFFLDIFIIENVPKNKLVRRIKGTYCNFLEFVSSQVFTYENDNDIAREMQARTNSSSAKLRKFIGKVFSIRKAGKWFNLMDKHAQYRYTGLFGIVTGRKHYFGEIFEENVFFPAKYVKFCDIEAPVFNDMDTYLKNLYGDYMKLPPEDKREKHSVVEIKFPDDE